MGLQTELDELLKKEPYYQALADDVLMYLNYQQSGMATINGTMISIVLSVKDFIEWRKKNDTNRKS